MAVKEKNFVHNTNVVSKKQYDEHLKLYSGYIKKTNEITEQLNKAVGLGAANAVYSVYRGLKEGETFALDGCILHELYFQNLTHAKETSPGTRVLNVLNAHFGGYDNFAADLIACATAARGWCIFSYEQRTRSFRNILLDSHNLGVVCMAYPIIVLDMYEHAYFMDYGTNKAEYIKKFIECVNWDVVEKRLAKLDTVN